MAGEVIMAIAYGIEVTRDDPYVELAERGLYAVFRASGFRGMIFDVIPFCA